MSHPLVQISSEHCQSQTGRARELKFRENVHFTLCVSCLLSGVTSHLSSVTCHMSFLFIKEKKNEKKMYILEEKKGQSGGASRWRACYQQGLPRLVFVYFCFAWSSTFYFTLKCSNLEPGPCVPNMQNSNLGCFHLVINYHSLFVGINKVRLFTIQNLTPPSRG